MQNTSPKNQTSIETTKPKKPRRLKWILLTITLIIASPFLIHYGTTELHRWQMRSYLENKYNQEFIVERPERKGSGLGVEGTMSANARPKHDSRLEFLVQSSSVGTEDYYLSSIWSRSEGSKLDLVVDKQWVRPKLFVSAQYEARASYKGTPKSYEEMIKLDGKDLIYIISVTRNTDKLLVDDKDRDQLRAMIDHINRQRVGYRSIKYTIYYKETDTTITCNIDSKNIHEIIDVNQVYKCFRKGGVSDERY